MNTVPAPIIDRPSIQKLFLNLRTKVHLTQNRSLEYGKCRHVKRMNSRQIYWVWLLFKSVHYQREYDKYT